MHSLDVVITKNAEAAGREAGHVRNALEFDPCCSDCGEAYLPCDGSCTYCHQAEGSLASRLDDIRVQHVFEDTRDDTKWSAFARGWRRGRQEG